MNIVPGRRIVGALIGLLSAGMALGVGEAVAAFVRPAAAPVIAVGNRFILLTPEPVKRWAIRTFGTSDKQALITGIYAVVALAAIGFGLLALRRLAYGLAGITAFGAVGIWAALTTQDHHASDAVPIAVGALAGAALMIWLVRTAGPPPPGLDELPRQATIDEDGRLTERRRFLVGSAGAAGLAALTGFGGRWAQHRRFDVAEARAKVVLPPVSTPVVSGADLGKGAVKWATPNGDFYRIDTALTFPQIEPKHWRLRIHGMVDREITLTYDELLARPLIERWITLCCVSNEVGGNLIGNARWLGARLADVLHEAGVHPDADQLLMTSQDLMTIGAPTAVVMDGRDSLIAVGMNGQPLPIKHGFPARIVVPGLYGYVSACKWVVEIEATTFAKDQAYWVRGGWAAQTEIKLQSRIDTPRNGDSVEVGKPVAIAGVAWDQHVGVSAVEVQIDRGAWQPARLAAVPSTDTWRQWVLPWTPPSKGAHVIRVRAVDAAGTPQTEQVHDVFPDGATGLHSITVRAR